MPLAAPISSRPGLYVLCLGRWSGSGVLAPARVSSAPSFAHPLCFPSPKVLRLLPPNFHLTFCISSPQTLIRTDFPRLCQISRLSRNSFYLLTVIQAQNTIFCFIFHNLSFFLCSILSLLRAYFLFCTHCKFQAMNKQTKCASLTLYSYLLI